jgi:hypothetical protein
MAAEMKNKPESIRPILLLPSTVDEKEANEARLAGYIVIVCDDLAKVRLLSPMEEVRGGDILQSLAHAVLATPSGLPKEAFGAELCRRIRSNEK